MTILEDTSLCAIVRDEIMNPAGGIERFVRAIVPHVGKAVVFDTGSIDGTREKLRELSREFRNMRVYDRPFDNYVNARNASLEKVKTKWTLVLDADELITRAEFEELAGILKEANGRKPSVLGYNFKFREVSKVGKKGYGHNPRLFQNKAGFFYTGNSDGAYEILNLRITPTKNTIAEYHYQVAHLPKTIQIFHFVSPDESSLNFKMREWYNCPKKWAQAPSRIKNSAVWKAYNLLRVRYE
jgi:glycosyltransferase involved in cell wall biosynthesis